MSQKKYFSYIRVSTQRQGQHGTSLGEQQAAIERFAGSWNLQIIKRFEERETAAKQGRPVFLDMLKQLKAGKANGVIIHKIDRSARNLKDWADLGSLIDSGLEVHFAAESLDLNSRGGRLSADIQAVVASDYIRNLREETKKGLYGRLKQGLYPFRAPIGYLDKGKGQPKEIDPVSGPMVRRAFELYATGEWSLIPLTDELNRCNLRGRTGKKLTLNGIATLLHNPFYKGLIRIEKTGETFAGLHQPIVSREVFEQVQNIFAGKNARKSNRHFAVYRRLIGCGKCSRIMTAEIQKGITYYRCRTRRCTPGCLRETEVTEEMLTLATKIKFLDEEYSELRRTTMILMRKSKDATRSESDRLKLEIKKITDSLSKIADAYMEDIFDEETYLRKKNELVESEYHLRQRLVKVELDDREAGSEFDSLCELTNSAYLSFESGTDAQRRDLTRILCANLSWNGEKVLIKPKDPFRMIAERPSFLVGSPSRVQRRTITQLAKQLVQYFVENPGRLRAESLG